jgi:hypothetical protein
MNKESLQAFYEQGYTMLLDYRQMGVNLVDTEEWFARRMDPESYAHWANNPPAVTNVTDAHFRAKSSEEQKAFREKMLFRMMNGWFSECQSFFRLSNAAQADLRAQYPLAGYIYHQPGPYFMLYNMCQVLDVNSDLTRGGGKPFIANRRDNFLHDVFECLARHRLGPGERRSIVYMPKARGCHYSTTIEGRALRGLLTVPMYRHAIAINSEEGITKYVDEIERLYTSLPRWMRPYKAAVGRKNEIVEMYSARGGARGMFRLKVYNPQTGNEVENAIAVTTHMPTKIEGDRFVEMDIDESGISPFDLTKTVSRMEGLMMDGRGQVNGLLTIGGTSDASNALNLDFLSAIAYQPASLNAFTVTTGTQHFLEPDEKGYVNTARNTEVLLKRRAELALLPNSAGLLLEEMTKNPMSLEDILRVSGRSDLDVLALERRRDALRNQILTGELILQSGYFKETAGDIARPTFVPERDGPWKVWRHPTKEEVFRGLDLRPQPHFFSSTDDVMHDMTPAEAERLRHHKGSRSFNAMIVFDAHESQAVAVFHYRSADRTQDFRQMMMGFLYYRCFCFPERNTNQFMDYVINYQDGKYARHSFVQYLYRTPLPKGNYNRIFAPLAIKRGYDTKANKVDIYHTTIPAHFAAHLNKVMFPEILEEYAKWRPEVKSYNPDIANAYMVGVIGLNDYQSLGLRHRTKGAPINNKVLAEAANMGILSGGSDLAPYSW